MCALRGSQTNDVFDGERYLTNFPGGIAGGISNGAEIVVRVAVRPPPPSASRRPPRRATGGHRHARHRGPPRSVHLPARRAGGRGHDGARARWTPGCASAPCAAATAREVASPGSSATSQPPVPGPGCAGRPHTGHEPLLRVLTLYSGVLAATAGPRGARPRRAPVARDLRLLVSAVAYSAHARRPCLRAPRQSYTGQGPRQPRRRRQRRPGRPPPWRTRGVRVRGGRASCCHVYDDRGTMVDLGIFGARRVRRPSVNCRRGGGLGRAARIAGSARSCGRAARRSTSARSAAT